MSLAFIYYFIFRIRKLLSKSVQNKNIFSIRIGNVTAGGTGKTEIAKLIGSYLQENGVKFCFLSSGYGRYSSGLIKIEKGSKVDPFFAGDEVAILSIYGDVFVSDDRKNALMNMSGYDIVIMDDGLQDYSIEANLNILLIDSDHGLGNGMILPSGPMRCAIKDLPRIDAVIQTSSNDKKLTQDVEKIKDELGIDNIFTTQVISKSRPTKDKYIAFSGLGLNKKFLTSLRDNGYNIINFIEFPDHYPYKESDIKNIIEISQDFGVITTKKDYLKIKNFDISSRIEVFYIEHKVDNEFFSMIDGKFLLYKNENRDKV
jgi:tetraacyldisaccharide 4'-kinase